MEASILKARVKMREIDAPGIAGNLQQIDEGAVYSRCAEDVASMRRCRRSKVMIERMSVLVDVSSAPLLEEILAGEALEQLQCLEAHLSRRNE
eukprot:2402294-Amphidinium_carterae.2